ncbi:formate dehydrogenase accessory sulfurtransferase FdhD [Undibacterium sp. 5I1]|uniref:formate dehydrogenase accessory sulfurtransferase FdhD n=1 Tax=unclassified Undibacterium TaxID=2630295 RepID=UPI002AB388A8|nr:MULTISPECIES: formate dehydrogenase accessory sulfurtransferase FdhD [unclassified Undibacterium]MDY7537735.1 formate dehydrogenase accessory sulfurtransferase FdhD [Undibacterium sp. 5I1]MEB0229851.1 formate dehydrogenase accessory sulfurtransferase FdhD [Undibacterium sp. 10I3]MEB0259704.1 formate dehydrogenase accessory sulfurtransferase FdhD [Undibacterium sp. 5I1]
MSQEIEHAYREMSVLRHSANQNDSPVLPTPDQLAEEIPIALVFNGISHAVMMATPLDLEDFAVGFSLAEQIIDHASQIYDIECVNNDAVGQSANTVGVEVRMTIASECFVRLKEKRRSLIGKTGCGVCGLESLNALDLNIPTLVPVLMPIVVPALMPGNASASNGDVQPETRLDKQALLKAFDSLKSKQPINAITGAMHAAAWVDMTGAIQLVREDVGRHNALDKLVGALAIDAKLNSKGKSIRQPGFAIMSSRASYELVQKSARANIAILATISAPTALAVRLAEQAGMCLIGFVRQKNFVVYSHPERLLLTEHAE